VTKWRDKWSFVTKKNDFGTRFAISSSTIIRKKQLKKIQLWERLLELT
jgi:hypothetical protein